MRSNSYIYTCSINAKGDVADVNTWDYEMASLIGTFTEPSARDPSFAATSLCFCHPFPLLAAGTETGVVHLWNTSTLTYTVTLAQR